MKRFARITLLSLNVVGIIARNNTNNKVLKLLFCVKLFLETKNDCTAIVNNKAKNKRKFVERDEKLKS